VGDSEVCGLVGREGRFSLSPLMSRILSPLARCNLATFQAFAYKSGRRQTLLWSTTRRTRNSCPGMFGRYIRRKKSMDI
jgi:hypothetical protein